MTAAGQPHKSAFQDEPNLAVDQKILRAYMAGLDSFNAGNWDATIAACAKALEGVAKNELPYSERGGTMGQLLERLPKHIKTDQPLIDLAAAAKDPKGLGGLFDLDKEANEEVAKATLSLVEAFVTYVYLLTSKVEQLKRLVEDKRQPTGGAIVAPAAPAGQAVHEIKPSVSSVKRPEAPKRVVTEDDPDPFELASSRWDMDKKS